MKNPTPTAPPAEAPKATPLPLEHVHTTGDGHLLVRDGMLIAHLNNRLPQIGTIGKDIVRAVNSHAALEARCAELEGALRKIAGGDTWETIMCDNDGMGCSCVEFATKTLEALAHPHAAPGGKEAL